MGDTKALIGTIIYWAAILLALFGVVSTIMAAALFEGEERLWGTLQWAAFAIAAYVLGRVARYVLSR